MDGYLTPQPGNAVQPATGSPPARRTTSARGVPSKGKLQRLSRRLIMANLEEALNKPSKLELSPATLQFVKIVESWSDTPEGKAEVKEFLKRVKGA